MKRASDLKEAQRRINGAYNTLIDAQDAINACTCKKEKKFWKEEELKERVKAKVISENVEELIDAHKQLLEEHKKKVKGYEELVAKNRETDGKYKSLQEKYNELVERFGSKVSEYEELKEKYENGKSQWQREELGYVRTEERFQSSNKQLVKVENEKNQLAIKVNEKDAEVRKLSFSILVKFFLTSIIIGMIDACVWVVLRSIQNKLFLTGAYRYKINFWERMIVVSTVFFFIFLILWFKFFRKDSDGWG